MEQPAGYIDASENDKKKQILTAPQVYSMPERDGSIKSHRERSRDFKISENQNDQKVNIDKTNWIFMCFFEKWTTKTKN